MKPFFIVSLPRSGTAWLSNFLTHGSCFCYHELSYGISSMGEFREIFERNGSPVVGTADTAGCLYAQAIHHQFPDARIVVLVRDPREIRDSLAKVGLNRNESEISVLATHLHWAIENLNALVVQYERLFSQTEVRRVWEYLRVPDPFPWRRFEMLREFRIEDHHRFVPEGNSDPEMIGRFNKFIQSLPPKVSHSRLN